MKKILIVDWLDKYGGAERVLTVLNKQFDFDKCFTLINIMSNSDLNRVFNGKKIKIVESNLRLLKSGFRYLFFLFPFFISKFSFLSFIAISISSELGYNVKAFCFQDSPRRAHSIAAQGGINAAKNYQGDGDSIYRLFYDTVKGGDYRSREENVYRLAEVSANIIDQCVAQGVPFARDYGGLLDNRSFGGVLVSRTFYAKGQTGQQLLLGAYSAMNRQIARGKIKMYNRHEMLDIVLVDGKARGIIARNLVTGEIERHSAHAVVLGSGGYGNVFYLSTNAMGSNVTAAWKAHKRGAFFANPCFTQIHPTCIPVSGDHQSKLTLMSESLRNDGRIWVPKNKKDAESVRNGSLSPTEISEENRDYFLERRYPAFGNLVPRDVASIYNTKISTIRFLDKKLIL